MKVYELTYIISSEITGEEAGVITKEIDSFVESNGGTIVRSDSPIAKTLSYPIKKMGSGYFVVLEFQIEPEKLSELKEKLEKDKKILRNVIVIKKPVKARRERRGARKSLFSTETESTEVKNTVTEEVPATETEEEKESSSEETPKDKEKKPTQKVELEEIEKKLDEILGE